METNDIQWSEIEPNIWKPVVAEEAIEGTLLGIEDNVGANNSKMYLLEKEGAHTKFWGSTVLDERMQCVQPGQYIRVTYKGNEKNKKGQPVKVFSVAIAKLKPKV